MSGEKHKPNQGLEFFYKLSLNGEFNENLLEARTQLGIPKKGFAANQRRASWIKNNLSKMLTLQSIEIILKKRYGIPTSYLLFLDDYIFFGKPMRGPLIKNRVAVIDPTRELESFYKETDEPYTTVLIFGSATKTEAIEFIKKHWNEIGVEKRKFARTRVTIYKERTKVIRELWKLSIEILQTEAGSTTRERDLLVSQILVKRKLTLKELSQGYIRKVANAKL